MSTSFILENLETFISNKFTIWPISSLELRKNKHTFETNFDCSSSWNLLEKRSGLRILIWNQIIVKIEMQVLFRNLILHNHSIWNSFDYSSGNFLEKFDIFSFIVASIPVMLFAILTRFYNKINFV